ncbi:hypothetical protein ACTFIW_000709 [Dictyostelium discoideum]
MGEYDQHEELGVEEGNEQEVGDGEHLYNTVKNILNLEDSIKAIKEIASSNIENRQFQTNIFTISFLNGYSTVCEMILNYFPNKFQITKSLIDQSLRISNIEIIKYFYKNKTIEKHRILDYVNQQLKNHKNFKYLDWIK